MEFRTLRADEIDVRVGSISKNGATLLFYKDARCDQNILDESVGALNWQRHHSRDNANCTVSIWDDSKQQWVDKEDTGTESYTEKEKGLASDSFKRACFNWGIGRELYTAPWTFVRCETKEETTAQGRKIYKLKNPHEFSGVYVSKIEYDEQRRISSVTLCDSKGNIIFDWPEKALPDLSELATDIEKKNFTDYAEKLGVDYRQVGKQAGAKSLKTLTKEQYANAMRILMEIDNGA